MADRMPTLEPVSVPRAADLVAGQLRRAVELGRFLPGDRLPAERELAVQLGVSRVTLRSALHELEVAGLLARAHRGSGGGALVVADTAAASEADADQRVRRARLEEICELRLACEGAAAELAAGRCGEEQLQRIERSIAGLSGELTAAQFRAADNEFHLAVAVAAGNARLRDAVEDARAAMFGPLDSIRFEVVLPSTAEQHRRILEAIAAGDAAAARASMVEHIREAQQELLVAVALVDE
jgi:DNA-binding FadR family transcriptional regulator